MIASHKSPMTFIASAVVALFGVQQLQAQSIPKQQPPAIRLPLMKAAPTLDGVIHEDEWAGADRMEGFTRYQVGQLAAQEGAFWVGADDTHLYVAVRTQTPPGGKILSRANPVPGGANLGAVYQDDSIEVWIAPRPDEPPAKRRVYLGVFNARDAVADTVHTLRGGEQWHGHWTRKSSVHDDHWDCEIALPWKDIGVEHPLGRTMGLRIVRNWRQAVDAEQSEWSLGTESFASMRTMPRVSWDATAPVVQLQRLRDEQGRQVDLRMRVANPTSQPLPVVVTTRVTPEGSAQANDKQRLTLVPGQDRTIQVKSSGLPGESLDTHIEATSPDGKALYYRRDFTWRLDRPAQLWDLNPQVARRTIVQFAYFPSHNALHVRADISNLKNPAQVSGLGLSIRRKGSRDPLAQTAMPPFKENISELNRWTIPPLADGEYELVAQVKGASAEPIIHTFVRHHFEWEGNRLGLSDIVVPPFTPIQAQGDELEVVLRRHQIGGAGFWNQVTADGTALLKAPMRLEAVIDGRMHAAQGTLKLEAHSDTRAVYTAHWQAGPLTGLTRDTWDYDGLMRTVLTLDPPPATVQSLTLVIPVDEAVAPLLHAVTFGFGNKFNYAGRMPSGKGVIWKSAQAPGNKFIGTYVPYIWLGAQERGLAVFGDNDAGWITDDRSDCQQIVRNTDGTLELRLRLIQTPAKWDKPRQIELGFLATPAKPMPTGWRLWTVSAARTPSSHAKVPGLYQQALYGSPVFWGGLPASGAIYPDDGDWSIWKEFHRLRQGGDYDPEFLKRWNAGAYARLDSPLREKMEVRARVGLQAMARHPQGVLIYTNAGGMRMDTPEARTFINEWNIHPFPKRDWAYAAGVDYDVDPVASYRDCRTWYYQKAMKLFTDGIYWDVIYLRPNLNLITTDAYRRPDGRIQPSAGLWNARALVRRGAVLAQEMGKRNRNMVHMTGEQNVAINDFAATQLDWEMRYGEGDFQDKFPRDYIQTQSIGRQAGLAPFVLLNDYGIVGSKEQKAWQYRTAAGVMLSHELKPYTWPGAWGTPDAFWTNYDRLAEFGYGQPDVKVYNYWQDGYPAQISGQSASLLVSKPGSAALVLCDYGDGGTFQVQLDPKTLSLNGPLQAVNMENNEPVQISGNTLTVPLKKHDFVLIRIDTRK